MEGSSHGYTAFEDCAAKNNPHPFPHLAFEVDDLEVAVATKQLTGAVTSPSNGVPVAVLVEDGVPIEVLRLRQSPPPGSHGGNLSA